MSPAVASSYRLLLPPGWFHIPVREATTSAIRAMSDATFGPDPDDRTKPLRTRAEELTEELIASARDRGALDVFVPAGGALRAPVSCSLIVSDLLVDDPGDGTQGDVLRAIAMDSDNAHVVDLDGQVAIRTERSAIRSAADIGGGNVSSREISWVSAIPGDNTRWLTLVAGTTRTDNEPDNDGLLDAVAELLDALVSTFRWERTEQ
jgi:hypothetical protein